MKKIIVHHKAEMELWKAIEYYESQRSKLGLALEHEIRDALNKIRNSPHLYPIQANGTRRCLLKRFPFAIYYFELETIIWIVAYAHTKRKPYYWESRI